MSRRRALTKEIGMSAGCQAKMSRPYRPAYECVPTKVLGAGQLRMCLISNLYLVEKLQQASKVIRSSQTFLWRMFELSKGTSKQQNFV